MIGITRLHSLDMHRWEHMQLAYMATPAQSTAMESADPQQQKPAHARQSNGTAFPEVPLGVLPAPFPVAARASIVMHEGAVTRDPLGQAEAAVTATVGGAELDGHIYSSVASLSDAMEASKCAA